MTEDQRAGQRIAGGRSRLGAAGPASPATGGKESENEEEERAMQRESADAWKKAQTEVLKKLIEKTFPNWDEKDWTQLNALYWKEIGA